MRKFDIMKHYFFVLLVTIGFLASCSSSKTQLTRVKAINIPITDTISQKAEIENFIKELTKLFDNPDTQKNDITQLMKRFLVNFDHQETGKYLDSKM